MKKNDQVTPPIIDVHSISKWFGNKKVLSNISLSAGAGDVIGIFGPNGAGKSTLLNILSSLIVPDGGEVRYFGTLLNSRNLSMLSTLNYASSSSKLNGYATGYENLALYARLYGVINYQNIIKRLTGFFCLDEKTIRNVKVYKLSQGENTKLLLCKSLLNSPQILLLDEVTATLDDGGKGKLISLLKKYKRDKFGCVLIAAHDKNTLLSMCTKIILLNKGACMYVGRPLSMTKIQRMYVS